MKKILAFSGSNNPESINELLLISAINKIQKGNVHHIQLTDYQIPIYSQEIEKNGIPQSIKEIFRFFIEADAFIITSPEHNGLPTSFFKNIIDWLSRIDQKFFGGKPVLLMSTSPGANGGASHLQILTKLLPIWGGNLVSHYSLGSFNNKYDHSNLQIADYDEDTRLSESIRILINSFSK
ncbi:NADPH-dependent FMN reductase [Flavivirga spongiicola]|uniref:NAD(P)H-dependent oxidoreductase n=1 Tax=Flavivirga spongiicola TaxID=421621 RepID=A0ABU7XZG8_9FLAO|nr:NAD(P)H-dependent oxidoreductase [Flavivirga sp. MEBiC05379]MDO5980972.1 NAD(P)H-dependent oxidoreductase [Flavivirga sp. MEBiC05379]